MSIVQLKTRLGVGMTLLACALLAHASEASAHHIGGATYVGTVNIGFSTGAVSLTVSPNGTTTTSFQVSGTGTIAFGCTFDSSGSGGEISGRIKRHELQLVAYTSPAFGRQAGAVLVNGSFGDPEHAPKTLEGDLQLPASDPNSPFCGLGTTAAFEARTTASGRGTPECKLAKKKLNKARRRPSTSRRELKELRLDAKLDCA